MSDFFIRQKIPDIDFKYFVLVQGTQNVYLKEIF